MRSIFLLLVIGLTGRAFAGDLPDIEALEGKIFASRKAIKSGEFEVRVRSDTGHFPERSYHIWLSDDRQIRQERNLKTEFQVSIFTREFAYYFSGPPGTYDNPDLILRHAVERLPVAEAKPGAVPHLICDPRLLMFFVGDYSLLPYVHFDTLVGSAGRENITITPIKWKDQPGLTVAFKRAKFGDDVEYDVVPSRNFNIVRLRLAGTNHPKSGADYTYDETVTADLTEIDKDNWFPMHVNQKSVRNGKPGNEDVTIINARLNIKIPDEVFTLGFGNKLPPKQLIIPHSIHGDPATRPANNRFQSPLWWDGKQVRPLTGADEAERSRSHNPDGVNQ